MEAIRSWLKHKDYLEGVRLYLEIGTDDNLKVLFTQEARTDYKAKRLERALRDLMDKPVPKQEPIKEVIAKPDERWPDSPDEVLKALKADAMLKFKELQHLRSQLMLLPDDNVRGEAAHQILRLDDEITRIWAKRDYYIAHGRLPDDAPDNEYVKDPLLMAKRMQNLDRYIRREATTLQKDPGNAKAAARRKRFIDEYNHYAEKLGADKVQE